MITIFIPTEFRPPKKGEWIHYNDAYYPVSGDYSTPSQIVEKHTIEVPEGADRLNYHFDNRRNCGPAIGCGHIDIPRKKVKKWRWGRTVGSIEVQTTGHHTFEEMSINNLVGEFWQKVEGSEIEQ